MSNSTAIRIASRVLLVAVVGLIATLANAGPESLSPNATLERPVSSCIDPETCPPEPCNCSHVYLPVCGVDGRTYGNACQASCAGVEIDHRGECRERECRDNGDCRGDQICYPPTAQCQFPCAVICLAPDPVCGSDGVTYDCGAADAHCHGAEVVHNGPCHACKCVDVGPPVCGTDGATYPNVCEAKCAGVEVERRGRCRHDDCGCRDRWQPVCGVDGRTYQNSCKARCAEVRVKHEGPCMVCPPCNCPQVYKPVCGEDRKTYSNACQAGCAGVTIVHYGECRSPYPCRILQPEDLEGGDVNMSLLRPWLCPLPLEAP